MKIFSNFDTNLRQKTFEEYQMNYGVENVLCFGRSRLYRWIKCVIPFVFYSLVAVFALIFFYKRLAGDYFGYLMVLFLIVYLVIVIPRIEKYIEYKMDFVIVIPNAIMLYDQGGIFRRDIITINAPSIKTISVKKDKFLYSVFNNGDILILTEGDVQRNGEVFLRRIPRPNKRRNQIARIIGIDVQANQNPH